MKTTAARTLVSALFFLAVLFARASAEVDQGNFQKGMTSYNLGDYEQALESFQAAIDIYPDDWASYQQAGYCYYHLKRREKMKEAFDESLRLHPDNPELKTFLQNLPAVFASSAAPSPNAPANKSASRPVSPDNPPPPPTHPGIPPYSLEEAKQEHHWEEGFYLKINCLGDYAGIEDFSNAATLWNQAVAHSLGSGSASNSLAGIGVDVEPCLFLDPRNAVGIKIGYSGGHGYQENFSYRGQSESENFDPELLVVGVEYFHYFPGPEGRFYLVGAPIFGETLMGFNAQDPTITMSGTLYGSGVGLEAGGGYEWKVSNATGFEISMRVRMLSITNLQNSYQDNLGHTGQMTLAVDSQGGLGLADTRNLSTLNLRPAVMDFTGVIFGFSLNFHPF